MLQIVNIIQLISNFSEKIVFMYIRENNIRTRTMAVGARDYIDKLLVKKYADEKVDNHEAVESMVDPQKMLEAMNDVAEVQKNMFLISQRLYATCYAINAKARYKSKESA